MGQVEEKDKPFVIALYVITIFVGLLIAGGIAGWYAKDILMEFVKWALVGVLELVGIAVGFYLGSKK